MEPVFRVFAWWDLGLSGLRSLDLPANLLEGEIPQGIEALNNLRSINLRKIVPHTMQKLSLCSYLNLSTNSFGGESMGSNVNLLALDFSKNSMSGDLPGWIFKTGSSQVSLSENKLGAKLSSPILASQRTSLQKIQVLDLSHNSFSGEIMNGIGALTSLQFLNLSRNSIVAPVSSPD
ncbi:hypothetical protein F3Y22_tig00000764pilonHSYRG00225 [Hibiscus syriacus]|uniref:Uncharacterized protein n=1 Tax=Hibiscus syriacus TaxID=106335 RepID=A0A6A3CYV4_HIBSY|nr:hypothetical protein F3Y22_tig00000764pilonHSYRG00225 [Hibiscus syriacus]